MERIKDESSTTWTETQTSLSNSNSTFLFIAVEYSKDTNEFKANEVSFPTQNFEQHVSRLDPNMCSAAQYSPNYAGTSFNNGAVIQQLTAGSTIDNQLQHNLSDTFIMNVNSSIEENPLPDNQLLKTGQNRFLKDPLHLSPDEQEVELLITDQATGISYSVSAQEYLVGRCLADDQQLLDALEPGPLLDSELLALDENTLKSQLPELNDTIGSVSEEFNLPRNKPSPNYQNNELSKRSLRQTENHSLEEEDPLLCCVQTITDKPVPTRARATLPELYLVINKQCEDYGVFARKVIPKRTQFGPLEGILMAADTFKVENGKLDLFVEIEEEGLRRLDISDENMANWMCFVKKAENYNEQNLVLSQQGPSLYYTTTRDILPKQELLVGYSTAYAQKYDLPVLKPSTESDGWLCFECPEKFTSSEELQTHLNVHDAKGDHIKSRKKLSRNKRKPIKRLYKEEILECNVCKKNFTSARFSVLRRHLIQHGFDPNVPLQDKFSTKNLACESCNFVFYSEALMKIHSLQHTGDNLDDKKGNYGCPACSQKFLNQNQLVLHVKQHAFAPNSGSEFKKGYKCPVCYKVFASRDRIQRHMLVHGSEDSKPLKCETCGKRFLNNSALACHIKTHNIGKKIFECPICKESFYHVLQLKVHVPKHAEDGKYVCPHCTKVFKEYSVIRKHIRAFHCERKHNCPHCSKPFPTLDKLRMHLLRHSDHREFLCADCGKQFKRKDKLKEHCKRMHSEERENTVPRMSSKACLQPNKKFTPKVQPTDYHRFIYKCHTCLVGFKRRGMLVNHLAKRHPDISPDTVPELNLPILRTTRDYYCQYCDKVYKSSSKRKAHILKNHPGAALPMSNRRQGSLADVGLPNPTFSQTVGSITTHPQACQWCHKQYASKAKLLQHQRKKHSELLQIQNARGRNSSEKSDDTKQEPEIMPEFVESLSDEQESNQYYHIVPLSAAETNTLQTTQLSESDSRLYRLLTTSNGTIPPR